MSNGATGGEGQGNTTGGTTTGGAAASTGGNTGGANGGASSGASGAGSQASAWFDGFQNADHKGYVQSKGFKDPEMVVESYRNLEKAIGVPPDRLIKLPEVLDDKALDPIFTRLGKPEKPEGYTFGKAEGLEPDANFVKAAQGKFHELGLTKTQGEKLAAWWNEHVGGQVKTANETKVAQSQEQLNALKKEWGNAFEQNVEVGANAAAKFGVDKNAIEAMQQVLGYDKTMKFFHQIGQGLGEDQFITGGHKPGVMTPAAAQFELANPDSETLKKISQGDPTTLRKRAELQKMAYPELSH